MTKQHAHNVLMKSLSESGKVMEQGAKSGWLGLLASGGIFGLCHRAHLAGSADGSVSIVLSRCICSRGWALLKATRESWAAAAVTQRGPLLTEQVSVSARVGESFLQ